jgi:hypothetical protein
MAENEEKTAVKRRNWDPKTKAMIVLQGLKGKPIVDICSEQKNRLIWL